MTRKGFDLNHIKLIWNLNKGEINFEEYLRRRGLSQNDNLGELDYVVNDNPYMLNEFLSNASIGIRCRAMKGLFSLTNRDVDSFVDHGKSSIGYFISENMTHNKDSGIVPQRNSPIELIYDLAIVFDLPYRFLSYTYTRYEMINSFEEYNIPKIKIKNLYELIEEILIEMKNESSNKRKIFGVKIKNDFFEVGSMPHIHTRVDIREKIFTIEMHLENLANINYLELLKLESSIKMKNEIYIRDAFLRDNKKLYILFPLAESEISNIPFLQDEFLWRNVIFNLKTETLKKLEEESIDVKF